MGLQYRHETQYNSTEIYQPTFLRGSALPLRKVKALVTADMIEVSRAFPRDLYFSFSFRVKAWNENISLRALRSHDSHMRWGSPDGSRDSHEVALHPTHSLDCLEVKDQKVVFHHVEYVTGQLMHIGKERAHLQTTPVEAL